MIVENNLIIRYFGLLLLLVGIVLNIKMYIDDAYPTYLFYVICLIGIIQIIIAYKVKGMPIPWQIIWCIVPLLLGYLLLRLIF